MTCQPKNDYFFGINKESIEIELNEKNIKLIMVMFHIYFHAFD